MGFGEMATVRAAMAAPCARIATVARLPAPVSSLKPSLLFPRESSRLLKQNVDNILKCHLRISASLEKKSDSKRAFHETKLFSFATPAMMLAFVSSELPEGLEVVRQVGEFEISEPLLKAFYLTFVLVFCWGAVVFGSMIDPYYESDEYREAGGNGTQYWFYSTAERDEEEEREKLWKEDLIKEIEGRTKKELEASKEEEKVKELV